MKLDLKGGATSKRVVIFIQSSIATDGSGLTGLVFGSSGLTWYYWRADTGNAGGTQVTLSTSTRGTFASGGFVEVDATNLPGFYEIGIPNAALASGSDWVVMMLQGATNMVPIELEIQLVGNDPANTVQIIKNVALANFMFPMFDSSGAPKTGLTITAQRAIDGAALGSCSNSASEISNGWYTISLTASDLNGAVIALRFSGAGANDTDYTIITQP